MSNKDWKESTDPNLMLTELNKLAPISTRKLCLFICACCRSDFDLLEKESKETIEKAEGFVDGLITKEDFLQAWEPAQIMYTNCLYGTTLKTVLNCSTGISENISYSTQADIVRHLFGNPFKKMGAPTEEQAKAVAQELHKRWIVYPHDKNWVQSIGIGAGPTVIVYAKRKKRKNMDLPTELDGVHIEYRWNCGEMRPL